MPTREEKIAARRAATEEAAILAALAALPDIEVTDEQRVEIGNAIERDRLRQELTDEQRRAAVLEAIELDPELRKAAMDRIAERSREWLDAWQAENRASATAEMIDGVATITHFEVNPSPDALFKYWLRSPVGMDVTDHRLPGDLGRLCGVLEDNARKAFFAGMEAAR